MEHYNGLWNRFRSMILFGRIIFGRLSYPELCYEPMNSRHGIGKQTDTNNLHVDVIITVDSLFDSHYLHEFYF